MDTDAIRVIGGYQTDFARNLTKEGLDVADLTREVVEGTLADAGVTPSDIDVVHVGNAFGQLFTGQGHLGAMPASVVPGLWGAPATRHEGACASGSLALLAAMADLESGRYDCALVVGVELEKTVPGDLGAQHMGAAAWVGHEGSDAKFMWPYMFGKIADEYERRFGLNERHLWSIAELNARNAARNPLAQTRGWDRTEASFTDDLVANPPVEGRLRKADCGPLTDGAAGVVLVRADHPVLRSGGATSNQSRILGWGHRTVGLSLEDKLSCSADDPYVAPHVRATIRDTFGRAGIDGVDALDLIETHDCFTVSEYLAIDHFGITPPGESWRAVENGDLEIGGRIPVNPSGGLLGVGHPVGATGIRMLLDCHRQVTGRAGANQVPDARRAAMLNFGGSTATTASFVIGQ